MPFIPPWSKVTCPFCFEKFSLADAHIRDNSPGSPKGIDEKVGKFLGQTPPLMGEAHAPEKTFFDRFYIPKPDYSQNRICPHCHMPLPIRTATGEISSKVIAVIGARSSGKSNYFGVLIQELKEKIGGETGFIMLDQTTYSFRENKIVSSDYIYEQRYEKRLYKDKSVVLQTDRVTTDPQSKIPLIYRIQFQQKKGIDSFLEPKNIDLIFFDAAGEDIEEREGLNEFCRYVFGASGIIFLIDPLDYSDVRHELEKDSKFDISQLPPSNKDPDKIVSDVINIFDSSGELNLNKKIRTPVAFVLSKSDMFQKFLDPSSAIHRKSQHIDGFDEEDAAEVSNETRDLISHWKSTQLERLADNYFEDYSFFSISSLGRFPQKSLKLSGPIIPHRVADPLLWLFWKNNLIPSLLEWRFPSKVSGYLEMASTLFLFIFIYQFQGRVTGWRGIEAYLVILVSFFIAVGFSSVLPPKREFKLFKGMAGTLLILPILLFIPWHLLPGLVGFCLSWGLTAMIQQGIFRFYKWNFLSFKSQIPKNLFGSALWVLLNWIPPVVAGGILLNQLF